MDENYIEIDLLDGKTSIMEKFINNGDFLFIPNEELDAIITLLINTDDQYMNDDGVYDGADYDEEKAFELLKKAVLTNYSQYKAYAMRLVEDYMDYAEEYLASIGAIEWE
ncbi:MAG: hypothetical protein IJA35_06375 [Clostridia bacterium]|nr:hypothetical protein [Clostridia bacterium]